MIESLIPAKEAMHSEEEMEPSIPAPEAVAPEAEALGHEDDMVPMAESVILIPEESVGPRIEDPFTKRA